MDFSEATKFVASIVILIIAGGLLGAALARRGKAVPPQLLHERLKTYADLLATIDGLRDAEASHKRRFIRTYQRALVYAPDSVVRALDRFVQQAAAEEHDPAAQMEARDAAVLAIRRDAIKVGGSSTGIKAAELLSIEVDDKRPQPLAQATESPVPRPPENREELA